MEQDVDGFYKKHFLLCCSYLSHWVKLNKNSFQSSRHQLCVWNMNTSASFGLALILFMQFLSLTWEIGSVPTAIFAMIGWQLSCVGCYQDIDLLLHHHHLYIYVRDSGEFLCGCTTNSRAVLNDTKRSKLKLCVHNNTCNKKCKLEWEE